MKAQTFRIKALKIQSVIKAVKIYTHKLSLLYRDKEDGCYDPKIETKIMKTTTANHISLFKSSQI